MTCEQWGEICRWLILSTVLVSLLLLLSLIPGAYVGYA